MHFGQDAQSRLHDLLNTDIETAGQETRTLDWSAFDSGCPKWLINEAFDIIEDTIDFSTMVIQDRPDCHFDAEK